MEQVKPAEVLGTGKAQEPRVCLVDPGNPNEVLKLGTRATHEKELLFKEGGYVPKRRRHVGVMEAELHDGGTQTHKQYEVLSMEGLLLGCMDHEGLVPKDTGQVGRRKPKKSQTLNLKTLTLNPKSYTLNLSIT